MRALHDHKTTPLNENHIAVRATDNADPDAGNAHHEYEIEVSVPVEGDDLPANSRRVIGLVKLSFQHGPINEVGVNGITDQALIAVVLDRWRSFQTSKWANRETAVSITKLEEALMWQHKRTLDRTREGVEGTNKLRANEGTLESRRLQTIADLRASAGIGPDEDAVLEILGDGTARRKV